MNLRIVAWIIVFSGLSINAYAQAQISKFKVVAVRVDKSGKGYIKFNKPRGGSAASCGDNHNYHLAFDTNTPGGQGVMSLALAAKATNKPVSARGTGQCDIYGSVESWSYGYVGE